MSSGNVVMIVDDDRELRESICELLTEGGFEALGMPSGHAALDYMKRREEKPDVILLDLMMPQMNGWEFRQAQLHDPEMSTIPVIVITAAHDTQGIEADDVLHKPLALFDLLEVVRRQCATAHTAKTTMPRDPGARLPRPKINGLTSPAPAPPVAAAHPDPPRFDTHGFVGPEALGRLLASDWSETALGAASTWPEALLAALRACFEATLPTLICWGPDLLAFPNDAFRRLIAGDTPGIPSGQPGRVIWPALWASIGPLLEGVMQSGNATEATDQPLTLERRSFAEECYFTLACSPIRDGSGALRGVHCTPIETTRQLPAARRWRTLRELAELAPETRSAAAVCQRAVAVLTRNPADIPFAALYLVEVGAKSGVPSPQRSDRVSLVAATMELAELEQLTAAAPESAEGAARAETRWPLAEVLQSGEPTLVEDVRQRLGIWASDVPPPRAALVLPLTFDSKAQVLGVLVVGLSPRLELDLEYREFVELLAKQITTAVASAPVFRRLRGLDADADSVPDAATDKLTLFNKFSQEFRSPLTLILGPVEESLADTNDPLSPAQRQRQELVRRNGRRLRDLLNTLFNLSSIEAGRAGAIFVPTDLAALTSGLAGMFRAAIEGVGLKLLVECPPLPERVYVDPNLWEKVVLRLVSHVFQTTRQGGIRVTLAWLGTGAMLRVEQLELEGSEPSNDAGSPLGGLESMAEETDAFPGVAATPAEDPRVGLAWVRDLTELHGGRLRVVEDDLASRRACSVWLPRGSTHLPLDRVVEGSAASRAAADARNEAERAQAWAHVTKRDADEQQLGRAAERHWLARGLRPGTRILVAEDDPDMRDYLRLLLSPRASVTFVESGSQAVARAQQDPPDLLVCDLLLPEALELGLVGALRTNPRTRAIPLLFLSARGGEKARLRLIEAGVDECLLKPFSAEALLTRMDAQLWLSRLRQGALQAERAQVQEVTRLLDEARRATRSREETLATVSHDLRSPLGVISSVTDLLQRTLDAPDCKDRVRRQAQVIRRSVERMDRLIEDLLDLASIDFGTLALDQGAHTLEVLGQEANEAFQTQSARQEVTFEVHVRQGQTELLCDKQRILQVLSNLVSNALKVTPRGGTLRLGIGPDAGGQAVIFSVSDTGPGIPAEAQTTLFDRWRSRPQAREGHGLGLSISKGIVEAHGGTFRIQSEPGRGSTFSFHIPLRGAEPKDTVQRPVPGVTAPAPPVTGQLELGADGGELGALIRSKDWSRTPFGPIETWPRALRNVLGAVLGSGFPMFLTWGPEHRVLYNDAYRTIVGVKHPAMLGEPMRELSAEQWQRGLPLFEKTRLGSSVVLKDGYFPLARASKVEDCYFTFSLSPLQDDTGAVAGTLGVVSDTTLQVEAQRRLVTLKDLAREAINARTADEACNKASVVLGQNPIDLPFALVYRFDAEPGKAHLSGTTGITPGSTAAPLIVDLDAAATEASWPLRQMLGAEEPQLCSDLIARFGPLPSGAYQEPPSAALLMPLGVSDGIAPRAVLVAALNPRRTLDAEYRSFLELVADQLSSGLAHARAFDEERRRAEALAEIDRSRTAFLTMLSHELRTPLTLILRPIKDALDNHSSTLSRESLELMGSNVLRLQHIVGTLLDFALVAAGRAQARFVPTDLGALTSDIASEFRSAMEHAGLTFEVQCDLHVPVYVDPELWEKIVLNLLSNALAYTHGGSIRLTLAIEHDEVVLRVRDTGTGIAEQDLPHVFQQFFPARAREGRRREGSDIGLALVKELVTLHGGSIAVKSRLGEGSTFSVRLPLGHAHLPSELVDHASHALPIAGSTKTHAEEASGQLSPAAARPDAAADAPAQGSSGAAPSGWSDTRELAAERLPLDPAPDISEARIIIVDDNADLRRYLARLLARSFKNIETAPDGRAALDAARANPPDIILSDIMMPVLDGFGLIRELRAEARTRQIPVVLLSAHAGEESTVEGLRAGADDYLSKPFSARELLARVTVHLRMAMVRREAAEHRARENALRRLLAEKDEFLTIASHEFRTPLTTISLQADGLLRLLSPGFFSGSPLSDEQLARLRRRVEMVRNSCQRLEEIIDSLLNALALNDDNPFTQPQEVDVSEVAQQVLARLEQHTRQSGPKLVLETDGPAVARYDRRAVEQIINNLLSNAIKFGEGKPVHIIIQRAPDKIRIIVRDRGKGIDPQDQERIFDRFGRAVSRNDYGGFGLGLWVVRRLAEALHGTARVESAPGDGSTFTIELPRTT